MANLLLPGEHALVAVEDPGVDPSQPALLGQRLVVVARDGLPEEGGLHVSQVLLPDLLHSVMKLTNVNVCSKQTLQFAQSLSIQEEGKPTHRDGLREVVARGEGRGDAMVLCQRVLEHRLPLLKGG